MQFSKLIVAMIIALNIGLRVGSEPTALIAAWFAFTTGELWLLSGIKREKLRRGNDEGLH